MSSMYSSPALSKVEKGKLCAGCGLCAGNSGGAVQMQSRDGYARPYQVSGLTEAQEFAIRTACPGLRVFEWDRMKAAHHTHPSWGPYIDCLTGHATDADVRHRGSSGGMVSALALYALESGLASQVLHVESDPDRPTGNRSSISRTREEVLAKAGSRYAPSTPLADIADMLEEGIPTVFIGKPCDVSALRAYGALDPRVDTTFPLKLSFFCGGIPSHDGAQAIIETMGLDPEAISEFRYRGNGWPGPTVAREYDGREGVMDYETSWGKFLSSRVQFRCKICPDPVGGVADIACADAWYGGESGYPQFDEADGRSLVMVRSQIGKKLLADAVADKVVHVDTLPIEEVDLMQPAQARRKRRIAARMAAWKLAGRPVPRMKGLHVGHATRQERPIWLLKEFLGTIRRIVRGRI